MTENLANFTDVLGDEICDSQRSQPISFSSSAESYPQLKIDKSKRIRPNKGTGQYLEFRSVDEIDPKYRDVFAYPFFNLVQSRVIEDALYSDKSLVVCAPTGSGKTVVFEMAIVQLLMEMEEKSNTADFKIIYVAPVKALCTERLTEWYSKFTRLGLLCIEVTGDTDVDFNQLKAYKIIITTPEKWDMLTRRWKDHRGLVEMIKLFLIDEVHILNDETRGPVLEAVVSRMKTIQSAAQIAHRIEKLQRQYQNSSGDGDVVPIQDHDSAPTIRFVAVSATVSNPEDVAAWLKTDDKPALYYKFGDECRPVKLRRIVEGYPCQDGTSIFKFDIILNYKLWPIIQKYHDGKPTLIFCNTRKSVLLTAETLSREITITFSPEQKVKLTALASTIKNKKLQSLVLAGVGCHHAGMLYEERTYIEYAFRNGDLPILITTTTLAMGVNLPAHLVIIKNTQQYVNGAYQEYSISTVLQMVGRAGRPQFDTDATAVIMTRQRDKARYQALAGGSEPLQSYLHKRLAENLNSETALGTVCDVAQCVQWLRSTFLYVRAAKDPKRYLGLTSTAPDYLILKKIEELCVRAMNGLASAGLLTMDEASCIESTEAGRLMSVFYLDLETMKLIMKIQGNETLERLLWIICECHELADMYLRTDERRTLNALNRNNAAATIRFPMKGKISTREMKLSCIIQAVLGCLPIPDPSLNQEAMKIMRIADRVCKCLVAYVTRPQPVTLQLQNFSAVLNTIILAKCIAAHLWENSPFVSKQFKGIGPTFSTLLATAGKVNIMLLEESHPRDLERIMNKGPPAGNVLRKQISLLPKYQLEATPVDKKTVSVKLLLINQAYLSENIEHLTAGPTHKCYVIAGDSENHILLLSTFTDKDLIRVYDGTISFEITRKHSFEHTIFVHCVSSSFAGIDAQCEYTFTDLMPVSPHNKAGVNTSSNFFDSTTKQMLRKQTHVSEIPKERKRKNNSEEISQSKEKKKRDNAFTEKIKLLKESFGRTSKVLNENLQKSKEMTRNVLCNLGYSDQPTGKSVVNENNEMNTIVIDETDLSPQVEVNFPDNDDDIMDDAKIDSILNEIETEIIKDNTEPKRHVIDSSDNFVKRSNTVNQNPATGKITNSSRNRKCNYKFLELLENNVDLSDENVPVKETGFSDAIKKQVDKFIQNSYKPTPALDLTLSNLNQNPESIEITSFNVNSKNDLSKNVDAEIDIKSKELDSDVANNETLECGYETNNSADLNCFIEELPYTNVTEPINKPVPTSVSDRDFNGQNLNNENCASPSSGDVITINNLKILEKFPNSEEEYENEPPLILKNTKDTVINPTQNNEVKILNDTKEASIFSTDKKKYENDKDFHKRQTQSISLDKQPAFEISHQFTVHNRINNLNLWNQQHKNTVPNIIVENKQGKTLREPLLNTLDQILRANQSIQKAILDQRNGRTISEATENRSTEYENNFSISAEKVDVQTKYTSDHKIRVIRRLKVDLDVREIYSKKDKENTKKSNSDFNQRKLTTNMDSASTVNNSTPSCVKAKNANNTCNSLKENQNTLSKKLLEIVSIGNGMTNTNEALMIENIQTEDKEMPKVPESCTAQSENPRIVKDNQNDNNTALGNRKPGKDLISKEQSIENVLQKYALIIRQNKNNEIKNSLSLPNSNNNNIKQTPVRPNRPFKIAEIHNLNVPLPNFSENIKTTLASVPQMGNVQSIVANRTQNSQTATEIYLKPPDKSIEYLELSPCQSPEQLLEQSLEVLEDYFKIDQTMLNPKTLLQNMEKDNMEHEIIPPPPQFCNDDINNFSLDIDLDKENNNPSCFEEQNETFDDVDNTSTGTNNLTPKEIETWTLQCDDEFDKMIKYTTPTQSYTVMRRKMFQNYKPQDTDGTTKEGRLNQFRINCKNKLKR